MNRRKFSKNMLLSGLALPALNLLTNAAEPVLSYANPEVLVDTQWVTEHLTTLKVCIVEAGYDLSDYNSGHIPGAVGWAWSTDFQHPIRKDLPDKEGIEELLVRSGIKKDTTIIVYGARRHGYATFALWLLKIYGHNDVRVMNGNREKWIAEGRPLTTKIPTVTRSVYIATEPDWSIRALRDWVLNSIGKPERMLVDVRTPEEYHGQLWDGWKYQAEASQRGGHIPGAVNIPWDMTLKEDGTFKSVEELQALYTSNGVTSDKEVISYCIVGGRSNHTWFVLTYLLGYSKVRLYDGSWAEWSTLIGVPIEK
ncbi:MAG: sulfurtransferase [Bacteroidales bacterium]|nr:sulfurtransferase [Bacteroidales bacterium]